MKTYRAYELDQAGHISRPPRVIDAESDTKAVEIAQQFVQAQDVELWDGARRVAVLTRH